MLYGETEQITLEDGSAVNGVRVSLKTKKSAVLRCPTAKEQEDFYTAAALRVQGDEDSDLKAESELFGKIRLDKGEAWDEFEAGYVIGRFVAADLLSAAESGDEHVVTLRTQYGTQTHTLREPSIKEITLYERAMSKSRTKDIFRPVHKLYDALLVRTEGYPASYTDSDIPADHKQICVNAVRAALLKYDPFGAQAPNS